MKTRPRLTAVLKWMGLSLCVLIFAAWFASGWARGLVRLREGSHFWSIDLEHGELSAGWLDDERAPIIFPDRWTASATWSGYQGWALRSPRLRKVLFRGEVIRIPLTIPFFLLALPTAWLFYRDRRSVRWGGAGRCVGCGYERAGLGAGSPCPECGKGDLA